MSEELAEFVEISVSSGAGKLPLELKKEFVSLCRKLYNYNVDTSCNKCIFKYIKKLNDEIKSH